MLKQSLLAGLAVAVFSSVASGAGYPLVRGQSPNGYGPMPQAYPPSQQYAGPMVPAPQYAPNGVRPVGYETYGSAQEPYGSYDSSGYCPPHGRVRGRVPREWNRFTYKTPKNLTYPGANQMPAVIQYPYYTCKGPDCFFYQGTTNRQ